MMIQVSIVLVFGFLVGIDKYGEKYANAGGCMQSRAVEYFSPTFLGHMAQTK